MAYVDPPSGWYAFGTHAGWEHDDMPLLEFSDIEDEGGLPLFERPMTETNGCPCECHKPKHEARKPHPSTMAGR